MTRTTIGLTRDGMELTQEAAKPTSDAFVTLGEVGGVSDSDPERAEHWKGVRSALNAASAAARVRDPAALQDAVAALTTAARALLETSRP